MLLLFCLLQGVWGARLAMWGGNGVWGAEFGVFDALLTRFPGLGIRYVGLGNISLGGLGIRLAFSQGIWTASLSVRPLLVRQ